MSEVSDTSESDTLLPSGSQSEEQLALNYEAENKEHDRPVQIDGFRRNAVIGKGLLMAILPWTIYTECIHLTSLLQYPAPPARLGDGRVWYEGGHIYADIAGLFLLSITSFLLIITMFKPITKATTQGRSLRNLGLHRFFCIFTFLSTLLTLMAHAAPYIAYVMITKHSPHLYTPSSGDPDTISKYRTGLLVAALIVSGCIRRGPKRHFDPLQIGTGFGMTAAEKDKKDKSAKEKDAVPESERMNVLDYSNSAMLDFIFLGYISPIAWKSYTADRLRQSDLPHLEYDIRVSGMNATLWDDKEGSIEIDENGQPKQRQVTAWRLIRVLWFGNWQVVIACLILETIKQGVSFFQVAAMHEIIETFKAPVGEELAYGYLMCWGLFVGQAAEAILSAYNNVLENYLLHQPIRMILSSLLFSKILRSTDAKAMEAHNVSDEEKESGKGRSQVMNLLTIDTGTVASLATKVWAVTNAAISLAIGVTFLYTMFGVSAFVGIACVPLTTPMSWWIAQASYHCDKTWLKLRDARTGAIKEFLLSIKVVKLNAWEPHFLRSIQRLRDVEVKWQRWRYTLGTLFNILADQLPVLTIVITFAFHTKVMGRPLDPAAAFVALGVFNRVKDSLQAIPGTLNAVLEAKIALNRLTSYLNQPEVAEAAQENISEQIVLDDATVGWPTAEIDNAQVAFSQPFQLKDVNVSLPEGKFTLVVGPLGSGKTLFLRALLGEAKIEAGEIHAPKSQPDATPVYGREVKRIWTEESWLNDSVSYAPQQAFIRHGTVRDNILFGQPMWKDRYQEALRQACLEPDLKLMLDGDMTEVGEHGVTLSGGQKARINLARCIYSRAKTVYMDDILSAVDAHTAQYIFEECLSTGLLKGRTVVLVTHHVNLCLPGADYFVSLRNGRIEKACHAKSIKMSELDLSELQHAPEEEEGEVPEEALLPAKVIKALDEAEASGETSRHVHSIEHASMGRVSANHYWLFATAAGGIFYWALLWFFLISTKGLEIWSNVVVQHWSGDPEPSHLDYYLLWYAGLTTVAVFMGGIRWVWLYGVGNVGFYNAGSRKIHALLLDRICHAPLSFFEKTPEGRLMNIFGQDTNRMDAYVADDFGRCVMQILAVGSALAITCYFSPILILVFAALAAPYFWISGVLGKLRVDLRRLCTMCYSPLISLYHDSIDGVVMIRAFGSNDLANATLNTIMNQEKEAMVSDYAVYNWFRTIMQTMTAIIVSAAGFMLVGRDLGAAQAGFIMAYGLEVSQRLFSLLEQVSSMEQTFVSAERINYYIQMDEQESTSGTVPPANWPQQGAISFKNIHLRYADDLPEVLKGVSFDVQPGHRVGLVGSTGSGKSTLALTLFRAVDPTEGTIEIDGLDIHKVSLPDLRGRLNMVVQDGSLCSGTLREALDITGERDDVEIYEALKRVHLLPDSIDEEALKDNPFANLDTFVAVEGSNFSQGQRQLLCLARALLKRSKILVMDEATSSVDFEMDSKITATIKECFAGTTMLVIAHRLATIMHYDKVLVLDQGKIKEYGRPIDLILDESSAFHSLCTAQGPEEYEKLVNMAKS